MSAPLTNCPVCGYHLYPEGISPSALMHSFDICPCCGCEIGFDDTAEYRAQWIAKGCRFHTLEYKPHNWHPHEQLKKADLSWSNPIASEGPGGEDNRAKSA